MSQTPSPPPANPQKAQEAARQAAQNVDPAKVKAAAAQEARSGLNRIWWILLIDGIATLILGFLLLTNPAASAVALTVVLGIWLLIQGVMAFVHVFVENHRAWYWDVLWGIIGVGAGLIVLGNPLISTMVAGTTLVFMIAFGAILMGIIALIRGFQGGGFWQIVLGIINLLIGVFLLFNPLQAVVALPWILGFFAVFGGISLLFMAFQARSARNAVSA